MLPHHLLSTCLGLQGGDKAKAEAAAAAARQRLDAALSKAAAVASAPAPKVEVGSLEEVISRMGASDGSELAAWAQVRGGNHGSMHYRDCELDALGLLRVVGCQPPGRNRRQRPCCRAATWLQDIPRNQLKLSPSATVRHDAAA